MLVPRLKLCSVALLGLTAWAGSCVATRNPDGSVNVSFAPDMVITTWGLESALDQLTDLLDKCITGNFTRPCTSKEMEEINEAIQNVLERKTRMGDPPRPTPL